MISTWRNRDYLKHSTFEKIDQFGCCFNIMRPIGAFMLIQQLIGFSNYCVKIYTFLKFLLKPRVTDLNSSPFLASHLTLPHRPCRLSPVQHHRFQGLFPFSSDANFSYKTYNFTTTSLHFSSRRLSILE